MRTIYLDYNATTPIAPAVQEALLPFLAEHYGHPGSSHPLGRAAREAIEDARTRVAQLLGAERGEIVFTSGGTESNNLALKGLCLRGTGSSAREPADAPKRVRPRHLVISAIEHASIVATAQALERQGVELSVVPCNSHGVVEPAAVERALRPHTTLVSVMHANHQTGVVQPIREIAALCRARSVLVHTDASQSAGKIATRIERLGVDLLTLSGHKMYAPKGIGALYVRRGVVLEPLLHGATLETGPRAGTENVPFVVALGQAAALASVHQEEASARLLAQREQFLAELVAALGERVIVNAAEAPRLPNTLSLRFVGTTAAALLQRASEICATPGSTSERGPGPSPALEALGLSAEAIRGTIRFSLGWYTTEDDLHRAANLLVEACEALYK